jgi:polar amino acid transport system substrate-binding protein
MYWSARTASIGGLRLSCILAAWLTAATTGWAAAPAGNDLEQLLARGQLVVAMTAADFPPFFWTDAAGQLHGYDVDLARDIGKELGVEVKFDRQSPTFDATVDRVAVGAADVVISKLSRTLERARRVRFTNPYAVLHQTLAMNRLVVVKTGGTGDPERFARTLAGPIGVLAATSYVEYARALFPGAEVIEYATAAELAEAVMSGKVQAAFRDDIEIKKMVLDNPQGALRLQTFVFQDQPDTKGIAVAATSEQLLAWLNLFLETRWQALDADSLLERYPDAP